MAQNRGNEDPKEQARKEFVRGKRQEWNAGRHGNTVYCIASGGKILLKWRQPTRGQRTLFESDTPELREKATAVANLKVAERQAGKQEAEIGGKHEEEKKEAPTVGQAWRYYLEDNWQGITEAVIQGGRAEVRTFYESMTAEQREQVGDPDYLLSMLQAMRRVTAYKAFRPDRRIAGIEPIEWTNYTHWRRTVVRTPGGAPYSPRTIETDFTRFNTVLTHCRTQRRAWWGGIPDPLEGATVVRKPANIPEITEEQCLQLIAELRRRLPRGWRILAATVVAYESGRRIGAIGADRLGLESEADGLRATDFSVREGRLYVTWRAGAAKGKGYGRGDETIPATRTLSVIYRWLRWFHPNPAGAQHPLLWSPEDPTMPVSYEALNRLFHTTWKTAFGESTPKGLAFHGFCRTVATTVTDELGLEKAALYTGRSQATIERFYRRVRPTSYDATVERLDQVRGSGTRPSNAGKDEPR